MVSAPERQFQAGFSTNGQTREHALLCRSLGIKHVIICINKMDEASVAYSQTRYLEIKTKIQNFLKHECGYGLKAMEFPYIPTAAFRGDNLKGPASEAMGWYTGPTVFQALDQIPAPRRLVKAPLRIPLQAAFRVHGTGIVAIGRVEQGVLKPGQVITLNNLYNHNNPSLSLSLSLRSLVITRV